MSCSKKDRREFFHALKATDVTPSDGRASGAFNLSVDIVEVGFKSDTAATT